MAFASAPAPIRDPIAQKGSGLMTDPWIDWFTQLIADVDASSARVDQAGPLEDQQASIAATPLTVTLSAGFYRVSWYARISQPATTNSSLTVTIGWTQDGVSLTSAGAAMTGNTTTTVQSGSLLLRIDQASPVTYATTYASTGATPMQYELTVIVEEVQI